MAFRILFSALFLTSFLSAKCTYNLNINFDFQKQSIKVNANIYDKEKSLQLHINNFEIQDKQKLQQTLDEGVNKASFSYDKALSDLNKNYIYLLNNWYPKLQSTCQYTITTNLPTSYKTVFENTTKQIDNVTFIASKEFIIKSKIYNNIEIKTYFLQDNEELSQKYLNKTIEYIKLYEKKIAAFPYKEFKIVENIHQTGYSMPTFTLIGSRLLTKSYILNQSLGHEILHQYFGNSIFNDFKKGNWVEGLTTYLADDYYKKEQGSDINSRKSILNEYENFVNDKNEFAIKDFEHRFDKRSQLIGYSKLSFVFHMLEKKIGSQKFEQLIKDFYSIYKFEEVNIQKLAEFFDNNTQLELKAFFDQWLNKKGQISFNIENVSNYYDKNGFWLSFDLVQDEKNFFKFDLPVSVTTYDKQIQRTVAITKAKQHINLNFTSEILSVNIDKNIDLFRKLSKEEKILSISSLMTQKDLIAVVNKSDIKKYENIKRIFPTAKIIHSNELKFNDLKQNSVVFLDFDNELLASFYPNININKQSSYLVVKHHIYNDSKHMAILNFGEYKSQYLMMLKYYSKYSEIILGKDEIVKNIYPSKDGISMALNKIPMLAKIEKKQSIKKIFDEIKDKRVVYVGESHDNFAHHLNQLRVIKSLHENGKKVAIAMEMFQAPFQKDLDEYTAGKTSLEEFLKNTQYYKRWKFDYNLYKPIIDYAKQNALKIVALNIDRTITKKVSKEGLFSLSLEQKRIAPKQIDQSNLNYKQSLENIFKEHSPKNSKNLNSKNDKTKTEIKKYTMPKINQDYFYQSQLIWDEIMAQNIDEYLKDRDDVTLVVIAGSGHIKEHHGIPSRVFRRNKLPYQVIINDIPTSIVGDIVLLNKTKTAIPAQPKLGVYLKNADELISVDIVEKSFASKIGIKKDDVIIELDGKKVNTLYDLKRVLYFIEDLNKTVVKIKREGKIKELKMSK